MTPRSESAAMVAIDKKIDRLTSNVEALTERLDKLDTRFEGTNGTPGFVVRIDRLEQKQEERGRVFWWALGIIATVVATEGGVLLHFLNTKGTS